MIKVSPIENSILKKQYKYLISCINNKGQIIDKKLKVPLNFQYHYTSFILSSIFFKNHTKLNKVVKYYLSIHKERMKPSNDFNVMLLYLAILFDKDNILKKDKNKLLNSIYHKADSDYLYSNNNFRALRLVGMILESEVRGVEFSLKIDDEIEWILNLQFDDGFFPDSNMKYEVEKNKGIPHLVYHTKIMMCVGLSYLYTKDIRLKKSFFKAMEVLLNISIENYFFYYGRSTNALFGYASLYMSFILAYRFSSNELFMHRANNLMKYIEQYQHKDGHISINLNKNDNKRDGFDEYMYDVVYNAYANALFLLANKIFEDNVYEKEIFEVSRRKIQVYKNSGFVVYNSENLKYCFNFKGHQNSLKHRFDSRVSPFSLLYYQCKNENLLPALGSVPNAILPLVEKKFNFRKFLSKIYKRYYSDWIPLFGGNTFFYQRKGVKYYPYKCKRIIIFKNKIIMKFESISRESNTNDNFVISIDIKDNLKYHIIFYEKVTLLFYAYLEKCNQNNLDYTFDEKYSKMKKIKMESSYGKSDLHRYKFMNIKKLKIKVRKREK